VQPWVQILSTVPTAAPQHSATGLVSYSGTSMATPIVSGLCALMLSLDSTLTPDQIKNCLQSTAVDISAANPTFTGLIGAGRIDAAAAMQCVASIVTNAHAIKKTENLIAVFPNPNNGDFKVKIHSSEKSNYVLEVKNVLGQIVHKTYLENIQGDYHHFIDLKGNSNGMYTLNIYKENQYFVNKLCIQ